MNGNVRRPRCASCLLAASKPLGAGPSVRTDDPVPVDLHHYEFYIFGTTDGTPAEMDSTGPAFEFNWGAIPRVQLHAILPMGFYQPVEQSCLPARRDGPSAFGLIDMELGAKIAFIKESKYIPQIGTFTMFEIPTGSYDKGLGVGKVWYKLPLGCKRISDTGSSTAAQVNDRPANPISELPVWGIPAEVRLWRTTGVRRRVFAMGAKASPRRRPKASTMIDMGGYYHFKHHPGESSCLLRPLRCRPDGKLRLCRHVLDMGRKEETGREQRPVSSADARDRISMTPLGWIGAD